MLAKKICQPYFFNLILLFLTKHIYLYIFIIIYYNKHNLNIITYLSLFIHILGVCVKNKCYTVLDFLIMRNLFNLFN
jgi:hypothetical protein